MGFSNGSVSKYTCNAGDTGDAGSTPGLGRSPGGETHSRILAEKSNGQTSLAGYRPWGHRARHN